MYRESIGEEVGMEAKVQTTDDFISHRKDWHFILYLVDGREPLNPNWESSITVFPFRITLVDKTIIDTLFCHPQERLYPSPCI